MTLVFLKVHTHLQRVGIWPFHALSAGELSQKPSGLKPFVLVSLLCPCIAKEKPDILNMKIFHILQGNLLVPEIAGFGNQPRPLKIAPTAPWKACTTWAPGGLPPSELPDPASTLNDHELHWSCRPRAADTKKARTNLACHPEMFLPLPHGMSFPSIQTRQHIACVHTWTVIRGPQWCSHKQGHIAAPSLPTYLSAHFSTHKTATRIHTNHLFSLLNCPYILNLRQCFQIFNTFASISLQPLHLANAKKIFAFCYW